VEGEGRGQLKRGKTLSGTEKGSLGRERWKYIEIISFHYQGDLKRPEEPHLKNLDEKREERGRSLVQRACVKIRRHHQCQALPEKVWLEGGLTGRCRKRRATLDRKHAELKWRTPRLPGEM